MQHGGSAGDQAGTPADEAADIDGMEAVHVFRGIDGSRMRLVSTCDGSGSWTRNAVHVVVAIQVFDDGEQNRGWSR